MFTFKKCSPYAKHFLKLTREILLFLPFYLMKIYQIKASDCTQQVTSIEQRYIQ